MSTATVLYWLSVCFLLNVILGQGMENQCPVWSLLESSNLMAVNMCHIYNDSHLDKLNGFILAPNGTITYQDYNPLTDECSQFKSLPLNVYFPLVFSREHFCNAAIPVYSSIGTDGMVSVTGYGDLFIQTASYIKEITFVYTAPYNDCTLQLKSMVLIDVQCAGLVTPPTDPTTGTSPTDTDPTTGLPTGSTSNLTPTSFSRPSIADDPGKYTDVSTVPGWDNSLNNPLFHMAIPVCPIRHERFRVIMAPTGHKEATLVCMQKGFRLASIGRDDLGPAISLVSSCVGTGKSVWIKNYWKPMRGNNCLELLTGTKPRTGGINAASNCRKKQPVLCEDPYFVI